MNTNFVQSVNTVGPGFLLFPSLKVNSLRENIMFNPILGLPYIRLMISIKFCRWCLFVFLIKEYTYACSNFGARFSQLFSLVCHIK